MKSWFFSYSRYRQAGEHRAEQAGPRRVVHPEIAVTGERPGADPRRPRVSTPGLAVLGPADVLGIEPSQVVRRVPTPGEPRVPPEHVVAIEFARPDLPWLFTPESSDDPDESMPWLMLLVVPADAALRTRPGAPNPELTIDLDRDGELPDPVQAGRWAHVQVDARDADRARAILAAEGPWPLARSRLVAPYRLAANRSYLACLVPVFEAGRAAGLGEPSEATGVWRRRGEVRLPVYHHWSFRTGSEVGDFQQLVERLRAPAALACGQRSVLVDPVAARLQKAAEPPRFPPVVLPVATALSRVDAEAADPLPPALGERLSELADPGAAGADPLVCRCDEPDPVVAPPWYGQWHAGAGDRPAWLAELNTDPGSRIAAGLGTRVVQRHQERLIAEAWEQLAAVVEANQRIRWAQAAAASGEHLYDRVRTLAQHAPVQALRLVNVATDTEVASLAQQVRTSEVPPELFSPAFVRVARYASRSAAEPGTGTSGEDAPEWLPPVEVVETAVAALRSDDPAFLPTHLVSQPDPVLETTHLVSQPDPEVTYLVAAAGSRGPRPPLRRLAVGPEQVVSRLDPVSSYQDRMAQAHQRMEGAPTQPRQRSPLDPIMAAPVFADSGVELLRELDQDWILGDPGGLEADVVALLGSDQRFVEAFLAGANHELARELRWRGYPTDLRGFYLRCFWEPTPPPLADLDAASEDSLGERLREFLESRADVTPLETWTGRLGAHAPEAVTGGLTVLVLKGVLLRRCPSTVISLEYGSIGPDGFTATRTAPERFRGRLDPDLTYVAYALPRDELLAASEDGQEWFVALTEPADEPSLRLRSAADQLTPLTGAEPDAAGDTSAEVAAELHRPPVRMLLPAREYL